MKRSLAFYTRVLDFEHMGTWPANESPSFSVLKREGGELNISTHGGDGVFGTAIAITVNDIDGLFRKYRKRGLKKTLKVNSPVHEGPLDQTWGMREFYVDDPDGNTIRFIEKKAVA